MIEPTEAQRSAVEAALGSSGGSMVVVIAEVGVALAIVWVAWVLLSCFDGWATDDTDGWRALSLAVTATVVVMTLIHYLN